MLHGTDRFRSLDAKKRSVVLDAAADEFASFGYLAASTNRIAASAKISKGALFSYFPTKEMLFAGVVASLFDQVQAESPELVAPPALNAIEDDLRTLMTRLFALHARWPKLLRLGHELTFEAAHIPDAGSHAERFRALIDGHAVAIVEHAASNNKLSSKPEIATELVLSAFDRLRGLLVTGHEFGREQERFNALCSGLSASVARAIAR